MEKANFKLSLWNWVVVFFKGKFGGGLTSVFEYVLRIFNAKVLSKVSPENLKKYSGIIVALAEFGEKVLNLYIMEAEKRRALTITVEALRSLSESLSDGEVTAAELESTINNVVDVINAWKNINTIVVAPPVVEDSDERAEIVEQFVP